MFNLVDVIVYHLFSGRLGWKWWTIKAITQQDRGLWMLMVTTINHIKHGWCDNIYLLLYSYYAGVSIRLSDQEKNRQYYIRKKIDVDPLLLGPFSPGCLRVCFIASLLVSSFCSFLTVGVQQSDFEFGWTEIQCTSFTRELFATLRPLNYGIQMNIAVIKGKQFWKMCLFDLKHC